MNTKTAATKITKGTPIYCLIIGILLTVKRLPLAITGIQELLQGGTFTAMFVINVVCAILGIVNIILFIVFMIRRHHAKEDQKPEGSIPQEG
ncbi:MAG: hypothetical protein IJ106_15815 [Parasporobacterium sp.]|nr:hypothetical protein [Parasporobacterium sp.]